MKLALVAISLAGCYSPELRDCVVRCASATDCAGDQVCSAGLCTGGDSCSALSTTDGDISPPAEVDGAVIDAASVDAAPADAAVHDAPSIDAMPPPTLVTLTVTIDGPKGTVKVLGAADCIEQNAPCTYQLVVGPHTFQAVAGMKPFEKWTSALCMGQPATCTTMLTTNATLTARFH